MAECSICNGEFDEKEEGEQGYFGIIPVAFCVWCYSSIVDMVHTLEPDIEDIEQGEL